MEILRPNFVVGIGGSAGCLNAFMALLDALPSDTGMAFIFLSHLPFDAVSHLTEILSWHTKMPVMEAAKGMLIRPNHAYVLPPNADLSVENYHFKIVSPRVVRNNQVDFFLISLAESMGPRAIGIILSGYDGDGAEGCRHIKAKGGTTFAQDGSAEVSGMPFSAQLTGCVDFVLPPDKIPDELQRLLESAHS